MRWHKYAKHKSHSAYLRQQGVYGAAWGIGWESGRVITQNNWYRQNLRPEIQDFLGVPRDEVPKIPSEDEKYFQ